MTLSEAKEKTFKREVAITGLIFWVFITLKLLLFTDATVVGVYDTMYATVSWTTWPFAAAAFGMDQIKKWG